MSKAFVNEDLREPDEAERLPERPPTPLPITAAGRRALVDELARLRAAGSADSRPARAIAQVLATVVERAPALQNGGAGFGCVVDVEGEDGAVRTFTIVGPDEADAARGRISITSPIARALLGRQRGDEVLWKKPKDDEVLTVVDVRLS